MALLRIELDVDYDLEDMSKPDQLNPAQALADRAHGALLYVEGVNSVRVSSHALRVTDAKKATKA